MLLALPVPRREELLALVAVHDRQPWLSLRTVDMISFSGRALVSTFRAP